VIYGGEGPDFVVRGSDNDLVYGEAGNDDIFGGEGQDTLSGGDDDDTIMGFEDQDVLMGDDGNGPKGNQVWDRGRSRVAQPTLWSGMALLRVSRRTPSG
jgi:Ca2+-binding RTX toxin-like protein